MTKAQHEFQKLTDQKEFGTQNAHAERLNAIHPAALLQGRMKKNALNLKRNLILMILIWFHQSSE